MTDPVTDTLTDVMGVIRTGPGAEAGADPAPAAAQRHGVDPGALDESALVRELAHLHATRHETFLHGSVDALAEHTSRTAELEQEWVRRHPDRDVDVQRTRAGARSRA